jgi:hypothetical protein
MVSIQMQSLSARVNYPTWSESAYIYFVLLLFYATPIQVIVILALADSLFCSAPQGKFENIPILHALHPVLYRDLQIHLYLLPLWQIDYRPILSKTIICILSHYLLQELQVS